MEAQSTFKGPFGDVSLHVVRDEVSGPGAVLWFRAAAVSGAGEGSSALASTLARQARCHVIVADSVLISSPVFPRSVDEAYFIACHVHEHADELGVDHRRVVIGGEGFGATLATAAARLAKERRNPALAAQLLVDPLLDLRTPAAALAGFVERYLPDASSRSDARASPLLAKNLIGLPPAFLVASSADAAERAASVAYGEALARAFVPVQSFAGDDTTSALRDCLDSLRNTLAV